MNTDNERTPAKPTGRKYATVDALMNGEGVSQEVQAKVVDLANETRVVLHLARLRQRAGITQEEMAKHLGVSQSAISKIESGKDEEITLREIREYARATGQRIGVSFGKPLTHVESVKAHALAIKFHLGELAAIANQHDELERDIQAFFGDAFFNILNILAKCSEELPNGTDFDVRVEIIRQDCPRVLPRRSSARTDPVLT